MIRPTEPSDTEHLLAISKGTGVFRDPEIQALREVLDDYRPSRKLGRIVPPERGNVGYHRLEHVEPGRSVAIDPR